MLVRSIPKRGKLPGLVRASRGAGLIVATLLVVPVAVGQDAAAWLQRAANPAGIVAAPRKASPMT